MMNNNKSLPLTIAMSLKNKSLRWSPWSHHSCNYHWEIQLASLQTQTFINNGSISFLYSHTLIVLIQDIIGRFNPTDLVTTNAMLQIAHSVFKRWRPKFRTDELFSEIKYVLELFCKPYLALFQVTAPPQS